jgi:hypothetical protein
VNRELREARQQWNADDTDGADDRGFLYPYYPCKSGVIRVIRVPFFFYLIVRNMSY